jgi:hypothetical protein
LAPRSGWPKEAANVLRVIHEGTPPRLLDERAFIDEVRLSHGPGRAPLLPVTIEALDGLGRLRWRAYCSTLERLLDLTRELGHERRVVSGRCPIVVVGDE